MNRREFVRAAIALPIAAQLPELVPLDAPTAPVASLAGFVPVTEDMPAIEDWVRQRLMEAMTADLDRHFMHGDGQ